MPISVKELAKKTVNVLGKKMAYVELGSGAPIIFLHGNPTSSYLWRNIMPYMQEFGRCIAPDLIGMGDSDKLDNSGPDSYRYVEHRQYLDAFYEAVDVSDNVTFVIHDWGSALGFDWARRHPEAVKAICYMEAIVKPVSWDEWPDEATDIFRAFRSPAGEEIVLDKNVFVENVLPSSIIRDLTDEEMAVYKRPFLNPGEDRRPTLTWPREIPLAGEPADVVEIVQDYGNWMAQNDIPKLFVNADPGTILTGPLRDFCRTWKNQQEITVSGTHFIQEDSPDDIGMALSTWYPEL